MDTLYRFCQQHGRLEPLSCFDGAKRSCSQSSNSHRHHRNHKAHLSGEFCCDDSGAVDSHQEDDEEEQEVIGETWAILHNANQQQPATPALMQKWLCSNAVMAAADTMAVISCSSGPHLTWSQQPSSGEDTAISSGSDAAADAKPAAGEQMMAVDANEAGTDFIAELLHDEGFWSYAASQSDHDLEALCSPAAPEAPAAPAAATSAAGTDPGQQPASSTAEQEVTAWQQQALPPPVAAGAAAFCSAADMLQASSAAAAVAASSRPRSPTSALLQLQPFPAAEGGTWQRSDGLILPLQRRSTSTSTTTGSPAGSQPATAALAASIGRQLSGVTSSGTDSVSCGGLHSSAVHCQPARSLSGSSFGTMGLACGLGPALLDSPAVLESFLEQQLLTASAAARVPAGTAAAAAPGTMARTAFTGAGAGAGSSQPQEQSLEVGCEPYRLMLQYSKQQQAAAVQQAAIREQRQQEERLLLRERLHRRLRKQQQALAKEKRRQLLVRLLRQQAAARLACGALPQRAAYSR